MLITVHVDRERAACLFVQHIYVSLCELFDHMRANTRLPNPYEGVNRLEEWGAGGGGEAFSPYNATMSPLSPVGDFFTSLITISRSSSS